MAQSHQQRAQNRVLAYRNSLIKKLVREREFNQGEIARMFNISQPVVSLVVNNRSSHRARVKSSS